MRTRSSSESDGENPITASRFNQPGSGRDVQRVPKFRPGRPSSGHRACRTSARRRRTASCAKAQNGPRGQIERDPEARERGEGGDHADRRPEIDCIGNSANDQTPRHIAHVAPEAVDAHHGGAGHRANRIRDRRDQRWVDECRADAERNRRHHRLADPSIRDRQQTERRTLGQHPGDDKRLAADAV